MASKTRQALTLSLAMCLAGVLILLPAEAWLAPLIGSVQAIAAAFAVAGACCGAGLLPLALQFRAEDRAWDTRMELVARAEREMGDAVAFAVAVGCPVHGTARMDYDGDGAHEAAVIRAQAGLCSHGGHGWDGETCSEIPAPDAHAECCAPCEHCLPGHARALRQQMGTIMNRYLRIAGRTGLVIAGLAGYGLAVTSHGASAAPAAAEPHRIVLVKGETGLAVTSLRWQSAGRASAEVTLTGEGAADLGTVRVAVTRSASGAITGLRLAGQVTVGKSWTLANGQWSAS